MERVREGAPPNEALEATAHSGHPGPGWGVRCGPRLTAGVRLPETSIPNQPPKAEAVCMVLNAIVWFTRAQELSDWRYSRLRSGSKVCKVLT